MVVVSSQAKTHNTLHSQPIVLWSVEWVYRVVVCQQEFSMMNGFFSITPNILIYSIFFDFVVLRFSITETDFCKKMEFGIVITSPSSVLR